MSFAPRVGLDLLEDSAAGRDFHRGNTPCVQHKEPIAVSAAEHAGDLRKCVDDVVDGVAFTSGAAIVVRDIHAAAANQPDTKHKPFHASHTRRERPPPAMNLCGQGHGARRSKGSEADR